MDIKSSPVHFYVVRSSPFSKPNSSITFEVEALNAGGAMNIKTGVFTTPRDGTYHFDFAFRKESLSDKCITVFIRKNGVIVGAAQTSDNVGFNLQSSISSTLKLKSGDKVDLFEIHGGIMYDDPHHYNHFTGWLMEEDLNVPN